MQEEKAEQPGEIAARLRSHRERMKMTQAEVSARSGVGVSSLSDFENGKREPTLAQLKRLAESFGVDLIDLLKEDEGRAAVVRWRERPEEAERLEARFLTLCRRFRDLERWAGEEEAIPFRRVERFPETGPETETLARQVWGEMQLGDRPGLSLRRRLEDDYGVKMFHLRVQPSGTAACTGDPEHGPAVLLNSLSSLARRTFDLAHELFHLLTWRLPSTVRKDVEERLADRFAAALLLPETALREAVERRVKDRRLSAANICELARDFSVSVDALLWRLHNVYHWQDPDATRRLVDRAHGLLTAYRGLTPEDEDEAAELPERYRSLAVQALRSGEISIGRFAEYMGLRRWQAMKFAQEATGDEAIPLPPS